MKVMYTERTLPRPFIGQVLDVCFEGYLATEVFTSKTGVKYLGYDLSATQSVTDYFLVLRNSRTYVISGWFCSLLIKKN